MVVTAYAYKEDGTSMSFNLNREIKSGGEGTIYKIGTTSGLKGNFCAKIYHQKYRTQDRQNKISFMINNKPAMLSSELLLICWPLLLLYDKPANGSFIGFIMDFAFEDSSTMEDLAMIVSQQSFNNRLTKGAISNVDKMIFQKFPRWQPPSEIKLLHNRFKVIFNIASIFNYLHSTQKYVVVDIKPVNLLLTAKAGISLVDVDSIQISENGKLLFSTNVGTPEYLPPEYYSQQNSGTLPKPVAFDLFALAVLFYEILIGVHPYGKPKGIDYAIPQLIQNDYFRHGKNKNLIVNRSECLLFDYLPINIQNLFIRAFEGQSNNRPQASEWQAELKKVIQDLEKGNNVFTKVKNKKPATPPKPTNPLPIPPIPIKKTSNKWYQKWQPLSLVAVIALCLIIGAFFAIQSLSSSDDYPKEETTENVIPSFDPQMIVGDYTAKEKIKEQVTMNGFIEAVSQNEYRITIYSDNAPVSDSFTYDGKPISSPTLEIKKNTIIFKKDNRLWELTK